MTPEDAKALFIELRDGYEWELTREMIAQLLYYTEVTDSMLVSMKNAGILKPANMPSGGRQREVYGVGDLFNAYVAVSVKKGRGLDRWDEVTKQFLHRQYGEEGEEFFTSEAGQWTILQLLNMAEQMAEQEDLITRQAEISSTDQALNGAANWL